MTFEATKSQKGVDFNKKTFAGGKSGSVAGAEVDAVLTEGFLHLYEGKVEIELVVPFKRAQLLELVRSLRQVPYIKLSASVFYYFGGVLTLSLGVPLPLFDILNRMPEVAAVRLLNEPELPSSHQPGVRRISVKLSG